MPDGLRSMGEYAFSYCRSLNSIVFPESLEERGYKAFYGCENLASVVIPKNVTSIAYAIFHGCNNLTSISVVDDNQVYDSREGCNAIIETNSNALLAGCSTTVIPNTVTSISESAFDYCANLTSITIPESVACIGEWAFAGCGLTSITCEAVTPPTIEAFNTFIYVCFYFLYVHNLPLFFYK